MALTIKDTAAQDDAPDTSVVLVLRAYARYVRNDVLYERGQPYKFTADQAEILLEEVDEVNGAPVWGRFKPASKRVVVEREVQPKDMTATVVPESVTAETPAGVQIGSDDEIAHLLPGADEGHTV